MSTVITIKDNVEYCKKHYPTESQELTRLARLQSKALPHLKEIGYTDEELLGGVPYTFETDTTLFLLLARVLGLQAVALATTFNKRSQYLEFSAKYLLNKLFAVTDEDKRKGFWGATDPYLDEFENDCWIKDDNKEPHMEFGQEDIDFFLDEFQTIFVEADNRNQPVRIYW